MVQAAIEVNAMSQAQKVRLADEIFTQLPNMLASILASPRMVVGMVELEVPLHSLLVTFQAMKRSGRTWPIVSEAVQETCVQRLTAHARFNDGLPGELANQVVQQFCDEHPERYLLAFVYGYARRSRLAARAHRRGEVPAACRPQPRGVRSFVGCLTPPK